MTKVNPDFKAIFESMPGLFLLVDTEFTIIGVSDAYLVATMVTREQIMGKNAFEIFPDNPDDSEATGVKNVRASLMKVLKTKQPDTMAIQKYDIRRPLSLGGGFEERYWSPINSPVLSEDNEIKYIIHRVEDVTDYLNACKKGSQQQKVMEELRTRTGEMEIEIYNRAQEIQAVNKKLIKANKNLAKLDKLKNNFFANISHELRTPLMLILGPLEQLLADKRVLPEHLNTLKLVDANAHQLLKHVNDLLDIAKLESGKMMLHYREVDLVSLIHEITSLFESRIDERQLKFAIHAPAKCVVQIDGDKIQRVLMNLIANAIKFSPANTTVNITVSEQDNQVCITIEDKGQGIDPDLLHVIFKRFFQAEGPTSNQGGAGLGLAIAKELIDLHRGSITASNAPQGGAILAVNLPVNAPDGTKVSLEPPVENKNYTAGLIANSYPAYQPIVDTYKSEKLLDAPLILIVEDNVAMNRFIVDILKDSYRIETAFDGEEGLQKALKVQPDLIISDIMMPGINGVQLVHEIRKHVELLTVPIMILSAKADDDLCVRMLREGAQDYMVKPFSSKELQARIANLTLIKKAEDELERFVYLASHDLKAPLPAMRHLISWIEEDLGDRLTTQSRKHLNLLQKRTWRMANLLDGLLTYAQVGHVHDDNFAIVNSRELVRDIVNELKPPKSFTFTYQDNLPTFESNTTLRDVFYALIDNSIKHHDRDSGHIVVGVTEKDEFYEFFVTDDGPGIESIYHTRIFELFQTLQPRDTLESSGVGLSVVKKIVELQGGKITVNSIKNKGATFCFSWPKTITKEVVHDA